MHTNTVNRQADLKFNNFKSEHLREQILQAIDAYRTQIILVKQQHSYSWDGCIQPLEEAAEVLDRVWGLLEHLNAVLNTKVVRDIYEHMLPIVTAFHTEIMQDEKLFHLYASIHSSKDFVTLTAAQQSIIEHALRDFKFAGVHLSKEQRIAYKDLAQLISKLENDFSNNCLDATENWTFHIEENNAQLLAGLPQIIVQNAKVVASKHNMSGWLLTLEQPVYQAVMTHARQRSMRKTFYNAYNTRASDQGPNAGTWDNSKIMQNIIAARYKLAALIGFENFAEFSLAPKMAENVAQVMSFLQQITAQVKPQACKEYKLLCDFAAQQDGLQDFAAWDVAYYSEMRKQCLYGIDEEQLRVYFPVQTVLAGLFKFANTLFGLTIQQVSVFETWHPSVQLFEIIDKESKVRGHFYVDLFTRPGKRSGAWMAECLSRIRFANDILQLPVAYLNCNFAPASANMPALLTHDDVVTLFHEFGHTLHHVLTQIDYYSVSGLNGVAWDAVELPSQFMENWCWEWQVIRSISAHVSTGDHLPKDMFDKLIASKNFQSALFLIRQLELALFDLRIHLLKDDVTVTVIQAELDAIRNEIGVISVPAYNRFQNTFSHIFAGGYAAGYYSYLWAEVLSCDVFDKFKQFELDTINFAMGQEFMQKILEQGGSKPAMDLFMDFAGREPKVDALLRHHGITGIAS